MNTVFQDYALFPHMTVGENVEYGMRIKKVRRSERVKRTAEVLELVRLGGLMERKPSQLSGGQRQRVALARAIVNHPQVLLLDEPLGALDLKLRQDMQTELKRIQQEVGITFVYVTHDQEEALTMSDRVAVFKDGQIEQVGPPAEIYEHPETEFVAGFVGVSNVLERTLNGQPSRFTVRPEKISVLEEHDAADAGSPYRDRPHPRCRLRRDGDAIHGRPGRRWNADGDPAEPRNDFQRGARGPRPAGPPRVAPRAHVRDQDGGRGGTG